MSEYETKLNLDNATEHLKTVLDNIRVANLELERVLNETQIPIKEKERIENIIINLKIDNEKQIKRSLDIESKVSILTSRFDSLSEYNNGLEKDILDSQKKLSDINKKISIQEFFYSTNKNDYNNLISDLKLEINSLKNIIEKLNNNISLQDNIKTNNEKEIYAQKEEIKKTKKLLDKLEKEYISELSKINKSIEEEKYKIKMPLELLNTEKLKINKFKGDLDILRRRMAERYKEQFPDKILPLELKEKDDKHK